MAYSADSFTALEVPTLTKMNKLWANDASFNDGTGIANNAIKTAHITDANVTPAKITNAYKFSAYQNTSPGLTNSTAKVPHSQELFDSNNNFNTTLYRYVAPINGFYIFIAQVQCGSAGMGTNEASLSYLYKNGVELIRSNQFIGSGNSNQINRHLIVTLEQLVAGDYIEHYAQMIGARDISGPSAITYFKGWLVTPT